VTQARLTSKQRRLVDEVKRLLAEGEDPLPRTLGGPLAGALPRLAERVLVLRGGRFAEELRRPNIDPDRITAATIGAGQGAAA
jgi:hypothetical protein